MHRITLAALAVLVAASPAAGAERDYTVTDFDKVRIEGPYRVVLTTGKASSARAMGSREALDRLSVGVEGRTLRVRPNQSAWGGYPGEQPGSVTVAISTHGLRSASVNGSSILAIDTAKAMRLDLSLAGSGRIEIAQVEADILNLSLLGSGQMLVGGTAKSVRAEVHGSGDLSAEHLSAVNARVVADTAGSIRLRVRDSADVVSTATGEVTVLGGPACAVKALGTGAVRCGD